MRKILFFLVICVVSTQTHASSNMVIKPGLKASEVFLPVGKNGQLISLEDLSVIKIRDLEKLTGEKMSVKDKVMIKGAQRQLRNNINPDGTLDRGFEKKLFDNFDLSGLLLGLFLSLIGVLIAYLLKGGNTTGRIKWAWIGFVISLIFWGALLI
jgi:hypothetical protein